MMSKTSDNIKLSNNIRYTLDKLEQSSHKASSNYNDYGTKFGNGMATSTMTFLALITAFIGSIKDSEAIQGLEWIIITSVTCFSVSQIFWLIDYVLSLFLFKRVINKANKSIGDIRSCKTQNEYDIILKLEINDLNTDKYTSSSELPKLLQAVLFIAGIIFATILLIIIIAK